MVLDFSSIVAEDNTISTIQSTIEDGKLGKLQVNASFIFGIPHVKQTTTGAPNCTTSKSDGLFLVVTAW